MRALDHKQIQTFENEIKGVYSLREYEQVAFGFQRAFRLTARRTRTPPSVRHSCVEIVFAVHNLDNLPLEGSIY